MCVNHGSDGGTDARLLKTDPMLMGAGILPGKNSPAGVQLARA